ncbi:hypothetical protein CC86DRAFT_460565 [Ophiobolus disseminans]|uniref:RNase P subunit Pop3 n=1 Tax=Ophiobolus disseminans TaxID=1469910 RepID=A0A6A6ZEN3_9PLEO|nr:hypothetical protein CC86DRAFT_460565 [Ophiobolus disseminans]
MAPAAKTTKPIFKTSSPFTETTWPEISHNDQEIILDLVCNLLAPLGDYRRAHIHPSRGRKRKRKSTEHGNDPTTIEAPPPPEIGKHILVGINSVTRHLEALAARNAPKSMPIADEEKEDGESDDLRPLSMVILSHPKPSISPAHAHLPTLIHLSSLHPPSANPTSTTTRLIPLASSTDARLASALHIPRVGALAIFAPAPGAPALEAFVQDTVDVTACKWIDEAMAADWKGLTIKTEFATIKLKTTKPVKGKTVKEKLPNTTTGLANTEP